MKTNGRSLAIALAFAVVLVGGLVYLKDRGSSASPQAGGPPNASSCLTLKVLASSEKAALPGDPAGWGRLGHPEWGAFRLGKTNPNLSTSGLNALIGAYFAATGVTGDLSVDRLNDPKVLDFVKGVESSVVHYGDISLTFLQNLQAADDHGAALTYVSAIAIEEKSVWDYNHGNPSGNPASLGKHAA